MNSHVSPPRWAELLIHASLAPRDVESITGDLLEEYRESVYPTRGASRADAWYVRQALGYAWRPLGAWAALFAVAFLVRTAMDWRVPTASYHMRSTVSTFLAVAIFLLAGFRAGRRSGSFATGGAAGIITAVLAAPIQVIGALLLLAVWHDPATMAAIHASGGLEEVFVFPLMTILPATIAAALAGAVGAATREAFVRA